MVSFDSRPPGEEWITRGQEQSGSRLRDDEVDPGDSSGGGTCVDFRIRSGGRTTEHDVLMNN